LTVNFYPGNILGVLTLEPLKMDSPPSCTAFEGNRQAASGSYLQVALAVKALLDRHPEAAVLIFDDNTGRQIDFDLRGTDQDIAARLTALGSKIDDAGSVRRPGRPKLGVVAREVTLLPRHWEWLATQTGGASVALRKLVEEARRAHDGKDRHRRAHERAYHFMSAMAGDLPGFEEAARALFANDRPRFNARIATWPSDVRDHAVALAFGDDDHVPPQNFMNSA
jgi:hypothetical protein